MKLFTACPSMEFPQISQQLQSKIIQKMHLRTMPLTTITSRVIPSFLPLPQAQQSEKDTIRALVNREDPLAWPSNEGEPINEFCTEGLASMVFPTLFPYGKGDPTKKTGLREVSLTEGFKYLIKYADL